MTDTAILIQHDRAITKLEERLLALEEFLYKQEKENEENDGKRTN